MASSLTTFDFALKERYTKEEIQNLTIRERILLAKVTKDENFTGDVQPEPVIVGNPLGVGGNFTNSQTNQTNGKGYKFAITVGDMFGFVSIGDKVLKASRNDIGAFLDNKSFEIDGLFDEFADRIHTFMYGNGGYALGRRASASTNVITLSDPETVANFSVGMTVVASSADGTSGSLRSGSTTVASIQRDAGTITLTSAAGITSFADNDYLFDQNTYGQTDTVIQGLSAWIPASAPSSTAFFGVDRSIDTVRLGGCRLASADYTNLNTEQRLRILCSRMIGRFNGPGATDIFVNTQQWEDLAISLESRRIMPVTEMVGKFGFEKLVMTTGGGKVNIWADRKCPNDVAFALHLPTWRMRSMDAVPHVLNGDGLQMLRKNDSNAYEFRVVAYPQLSCRAPGWSGRVPLATS